MAAEIDFDRIQSLRLEYTDQYVVVEGRRPDLARFKGKVGRVITINWNGRALVQFDSGSDRGWYDLDLDDLRVVEPPGSSSGGTDTPNEASLSTAGTALGFKPSALEVARQAKEKATQEGGAKPPSGEASAPQPGPSQG